MAQLNYSIGTGANDYVACIVAPAPPETGKSAFRTPVLRVLDLEAPLPPDGIKVDVPAGAPQVVAALRDAEGNVPVGVTVTVTQPDGTAFTRSTEPYDPQCVVQIENGSLIDLLVSEPQPGEWTIEAESSNTLDEYQFFFSTLPTANVQDTIDTTLSSMGDPEAMKAMEAEWGEGESWGCFWCKAGCFALGVVLVALIAAGATYVTPAAAAVTSLATTLHWEATTVVASLTGLIAAGTVTLGVILAAICSWADACP